MRSRQLLAATLTAAVLGAGAMGVAVAAGDSTPAPPPRIAFVAHAFNPADALAVGPLAGQLGAPLFTTSPSGLSSAAATGLEAYAPEMVVVAGGAGALPDSILDEIRTATGLTGTAVARVAGSDRTATAAALATFLSDHGLAPAFVSRTAATTTVTSSSWLVPTDAPDAFTLNVASAGLSQIVLTGASSADTVRLANRPALPVAPHGVTQELVSAEVCVSSGDVKLHVTAVDVHVARGAERASSDERINDDTDLLEGCRTYTFDDPVELGPGAAASLEVDVAWSDTFQTMDLGVVTWTLREVS